MTDIERAKLRLDCYNAARKYHLFSPNKADALARRMMSVIGVDEDEAVATEPTDNKPTVFPTGTFNYEPSSAIITVSAPATPELNLDEMLPEPEDFLLAEEDSEPEELPKIRGNSRKLWNRILEMAATDEPLPNSMNALCNELGIPTGSSAHTVNALKDRGYIVDLDKSDEGWSIKIHDGRVLKSAPVEAVPPAPPAEEEPAEEEAAEDPVQEAGTIAPNPAAYRFPKYHEIAASRKRQKADRDAIDKHIEENGVRRFENKSFDRIIRDTLRENGHELTGLHDLAVPNPMAKYSLDGKSTNRTALIELCNKYRKENDLPALDGE